MQDSRWIAGALLLGCLYSCGGSGIGGPGGQTCLEVTITYTGTKTGAAYLRVLTDGGNGPLNIVGNGASIQDMIAFQSGGVLCHPGGIQKDFPLTAAAWIDVTGTEAAVCSDLINLNPQCQPAASDPQAHASGVLRYGQLNQFRLDVVDPP